MDLEYLKMSPLEKFWFNFKNFFKRLPAAFSAFLLISVKRRKTEIGKLVCHSEQWVSD